MREIYIGIDPGLEGGVAAIERCINKARAWPTPTTLVGDKKTYLIPAMVETIENAIRDYPPGVCEAALENVHARPGQGVVSMFRFGVGVGLWQGILAAMKIPVTLISPQAWKKAMLVGKDKGASIVRANQLYPNIPLSKKDDGMAEALLLATYLRQMCE
jgi:crossover junction endodeoxyribonuclease RuvC